MASSFSSITVISSYTVFPSTPTASPPPSLPLSSYDLYIRLAQYNQRIFLFKLHASQFSSAVQRLKQSLSQALVHFYPLAGRLHLSPEGRLHVLCNDHGVGFIEASANLTLPHLLDRHKPPLLFELAPNRDALSLDGFHLPLLIVQVTQLQEDGMALGISVNHMLVDGHSNWHFINSWAEICRENEDSVSSKPIFDRCLLEGSINNLPVMSESDIQVERKSPFLLLNMPMQETVFHFTAEAMAELKKEANQNRREGMKPFSSYQAVSAHMWKCITKARGLSPEEPSYHRLVVECRRRLFPPLPSAYFGNVISVITIKSTVKFLEEGDLGEVARLLHEAIEAFDDMKIREVMKECWAQRLETLENIVHVGSSFKFPAYESDFGWGKPLGVRSGNCNKCDGKITFFPGYEGGGSVDAEILLDEETMKKLENLFPL